MKEKEQAMDDDTRDGLFSAPFHRCPCPLSLRCLSLSLPLTFSLFFSLLASHPPLLHYSQVFISDIRAATNKEAEQTRVEKELAKIRKKFATGTAVTGESMALLFCSTYVSFAPAFRLFLL